MRLFGSVLLVLFFLVGSAAAAEGAVLEVDPSEVAPGEQMFFLVAFPEGAQGEGVLSLGDGRSHEISASVGEVEVVETAPTSTGSYRATLVVMVNGTEETHEADYKVVSDEDRSSPAPVGALVVLIIASLLFARRRH